MTNKFKAFLAALTDQAFRQGAAAAASGVVKRPWAISAAYPIPTDIGDPLGFMSECDRDTLNALIVAAYQAGTTPNSSSGRVGIVMAGKKALDYQAAWERALHARHATPLRCRVWASARREGHGDPLYGVFGLVDRDIDATAAASVAVPNTPTS